MNPDDIPNNCDYNITWSILIYVHDLRIMQCGTDFSRDYTNNIFIFCFYFKSRFIALTSFETIRALNAMCLNTCAVNP